MATFLLVIIYLAFISLGLPDSLLGSVWPVLQAELSVPLSGAGVISMTITSGTIISSLASGRMIHRFGTGKVTIVSVAMTAVALFGFSISSSLAWLCVCAIPLGLGAGAVDSGLNSYVALRYKASHMNWLHCFWGVGATMGPIIMSQCIARNNAWQTGYLIISVIQLCLVAVLLCALPIWKKYENTGQQIDAGQKIEEKEKWKDKKLLMMPGIKLALLCFFCYSALEASTGLWGSSYLVRVKGLSVENAAKGISLFYAGITAGRFASGFAALKTSNHSIMRTGYCTSIVGITLLLLPLPDSFSLVALILMGFGYAPIFPSMIHETPFRFGEENAQSLMGLQMALAYTGSTFMPPLLGWTATRTHIGVLPFFLLVYVLLLAWGSEKIQLLLRNDKAKNKGNKSICVK